MPNQKKQPKKIQQTAIGNDNIQVVGNNNIITRITNFLAGDRETTEQRNRRIMLNHVENFWVKGILEKSLHGAALLELGMKEDPDALKYPWAIKREATKETLPSGMSMLEIFQEIGMGRSLLILGASGSGKTTMLLELTRQLIERAREDATEPIPVVFNLSSWTEKLTLSDWLVRELNMIYYVPKKVAPTWVKENKMLLLLDGLDEVRQENRDKCVDAINQFRKGNGLTSMMVCSRSQDYADLNTKLSFEGAIEVQPLTQKQIHEFFNRFGEEMAGIKQVLKKDDTLREMAETPLFLSIMLIAYQDKQDTEILASGDEKARRKHLFDTYIERMFERRSENMAFKRQSVLHWLSWLANKMVLHSSVPYLVEDMQPEWLDDKKQALNKFLVRLIGGLIFGLIAGVNLGLALGLTGGIIFGLIVGLPIGLFGARGIPRKISTVDSLSWSWTKARKRLILGLISGMFLGLVIGTIGGLIFGLGSGASYGLIIGLIGGMCLGLVLGGLSIGLIAGIVDGLTGGLNAEQVHQVAYPGKKLMLTVKNFLFVFLIFGLIVGLIFGLIGGLNAGLVVGVSVGLAHGLTKYGGFALIQHYILAFLLARNNLLPWHLISFLNYCTDLIFLRRVGGGYIFVHRLLMEHFADMYPADEK